MISFFYIKNIISLYLSSTQKTKNHQIHLPQFQLFSTSVSLLFNSGTSFLCNILPLLHFRCPTNHTSPFCTGSSLVSTICPWLLMETIYEQTSQQMLNQVQIASVPLPVKFMHQIILVILKKKKIDSKIWHGESLETTVIHISKMRKHYHCRLNKMFGNL